MLSLALLAASAAPGRSDTVNPPAAPAQTRTAKPQTPAKPQAPVVTPAKAVAASGAPAKAAATTPGAAAAKKPAVKSTSATGADSTTAAASASKKKSEPADYTLRGGQEGTVFKSLTVEGEDRVHVDFERPELKLDLDLEKAPGLDWGSASDVLNRSNIDLQAPLVGLSSKQTNAYLGRPWLAEFATGPVARFHPDAQGVDRWKLVVVDSKGASVRTFAGKGDPPKEIAWDGRASNGSPVTPGLTYSYVFEAYDKAGNKKNVVGQGFTVAAYRIDAPEGPTLLFSGTELQSAAAAAPGARETPAAAPILLEAASWLNQSELSKPIRVTATARSQELADLLAGNLVRALQPLVLGDASRLNAVALVEADAPEAGTLSIAPGK
jgi:hypothetical protein